MISVPDKYLVVGVIVTVMVAANFLCTFFNRSEARTMKQDIEKSGFAGAASCRQCHRSIYDSSIHTAHYLTSQPAVREYIKGSFDSGRNVFSYNKFMQVVLEQENNHFYQTALINGVPFESQPFDVVVGSGRKGQTYLYWKENRLFQLPVSFYTPLNSWCNSPGYSSNFSSFNRPINAQCLECHSTFAKAEETAAVGTLFEKDQVNYGISCERCHGPAADHVAYHAAHQQDTVSRFIINTRHLNRLQRLDACALCHSGPRKQVKPSFSFLAGDRLDEFSTPGYNADSSDMLDVHGNQYGLLTSSKCFRKSLQMDCSSCHDVHVNEAGSTRTFSQRCISCHNDTNHDTCTIPKRQGLVLSDNCIDCHMPLLPSKKIFLQLSDRKKSTPDLVRTHRIAVYPKETDAYLEKLN